MVKLKKTSLYLDAELDRQIQHAAAEQGVTKAEYIRRVLRDAVGQARPPIRAIGVGHGSGDVADDVDRHLEATEFGRS